MTQKKNNKDERYADVTMNDVIEEMGKEVSFYSACVFVLTLVLQTSRVCDSISHKT